MPTPSARKWTLTAIAMIAFASNSLLCRAALRGGHIDPTSFTALRLAAGALVLSPIAVRTLRAEARASLLNALALFVYAAAFSMAYLRLGAGPGALLLFGMVQVSMLGISRIQGQRLDARQAIGALLAVLGLCALTLPLRAAVVRPPMGAAMLMATAGAAWGVYSIRGRGVADPVAATARNFVLTVPLVAAWWLTQTASLHITLHGALLAVASGALASALGYVIWYSALKRLQATEAALVQLSVPLLTALAAVGVMGESVTVELMVAGALILSGIALAVVRPRRA